MRIPLEALREQPGVQGLVQLAHNAIDRINELERALRDCVEWMEAQSEPRMIGCHDRVRTARTLLANQAKTSGSPIAELHCLCGAEWVPHGGDWEMVAPPKWRDPQPNIELLDALKEITDMMDCGDEPGAGSPWHVKATAAIARATGTAS